MNLQDIDPRVTCNTCRAYQDGKCLRPNAAGLALTRGIAEIGPALAALPQRCFGFRATAKQPTKEPS
jgi:hypothetical protein